MFKRVCLAALTASLLAAAPKVIAVDIDGVIHPITVDLLAARAGPGRQPERRRRYCCA